jgi:N-formylglutamate deformylase
VLPILISIPHGGTNTPPEVADRVAISDRDLFDDGDAFTGDIYDVHEHVSRFERAEIARAFVDLNRAPDDRPPANLDGVVKTVTCYNVPIYRPGSELTDELADALIAEYHVPYHDRLAVVSDVRLALDCHSMAAMPPAIAPDGGEPRPLFCLSNGDGATCPPALLARLADAIAIAFDIGRADISLNAPFKGGYITRAHGPGPTPWIQVEMNRSLYLNEPWFNSDTLAIDPARLAELRDRFLSALRSLDL